LHTIYIVVKRNRFVASQMPVHLFPAGFRNYIRISAPCDNNGILGGHD
jgi:hypothetical protein